MSIEQLTAERDEARTALVAVRVGHCFAGSRFIADKLLVPGELMHAKFGQHFTVEDGRVVGKHANGAPILSRTRMGELADFDEAMEALIDAYPHRDQILKATGASGGGATQTWASAAKLSMPRGLFDGMSPIDKAGFMRSGGTLTD